MKIVLDIVRNYHQLFFLKKFIVLDLELLDESGYLEEETCVIEPPVVITLGDIRRLQLAKGAICAGLLTLATTEGVAHSAVSRLFVAGGFGKYLNMASAAKIGLLPSALARRATAVGNAALSGASMLLLNGELRKTAKTLAEGAAVLQLAESAVFRDAYIAAMAFEEI